MQKGGTPLSVVFSQREKKTIQSYRYRLGNYLRLPSVFPFFPAVLHGEKTGREKYNYANERSLQVLYLKSIDRRNGSKSCLNDIKRKRTSNGY